MTPDTRAIDVSFIDATSVECPTCGAWVGWACEGRNYGYHAAGYHRTREKAARAAATSAQRNLSTVKEKLQQ